VLGDIRGNALHLCWTPSKYVLVASEEGNELAFLFGAQVSPDLNGFGRDFGINFHGFGILGRFESARCGGHGRVEWW
jgi:hypothetical protein